MCASLCITRHGFTQATCFMNLSMIYLRRPLLLSKSTSLIVAPSELMVAWNSLSLEPMVTQQHPGEVKLVHGKIFG